MAELDKPNVAGKFVETGADDGEVEVAGGDQCSGSRASGNGASLLMDGTIGIPMLTSFSVSLLLAWKLTPKEVGDVEAGGVGAMGAVAPTDTNDFAVLAVGSAKGGCWNTEGSAIDGVVVKVVYAAFETP